MSILSEILLHKRKEIIAIRKKNPLSQLRRAATALPKKKHEFINALESASGIAVIAEIKRSSPSKGVISTNFDPIRIARQYEENGATALSVLTDKKHFGGSPDYVTQIKKIVKIPVLRKDFIVDEYQIYESRMLGADAVLLIAAALPAARLKLLYRAATTLGLDTLFEVHDSAELDKILPIKPKLIGVNNRDLHTFDVNLSTTEKLAKKIPANVLFISESGIFTSKDLSRVEKCGARAALVGESLMRENNPGEALKRLLGASHGTR